MAYNNLQRDILKMNKNIVHKLHVELNWFLNFSV